MLIKTKMPTSEEVSCFKSLRCSIYHANNVKITTIVGILTFMSRINFVLSWVEHVQGKFDKFISPDEGLFERNM